MPVCLVTILGISSFLRLQAAAGSLASGIHKYREIQCIYWQGSAGGGRADRNITLYPITPISGFRAMNGVARGVVFLRACVCVFSAASPLCYNPLKNFQRLKSANLHLAQQKRQPKQVHSGLSLFFSRLKGWATKWSSPLFCILSLVKLCIHQAIFLCHCLFYSYAMFVGEASGKPAPWYRVGKARHQALHIFLPCQPTGFIFVMEKPAVETRKQQPDLPGLSPSGLQPTL